MAPNHETARLLLKMNSKEISWQCVFLVLAAVIGGCAPMSRPKSDWRAANIHRVAVVCVQSDRDTNRRIEAEAASKLRRQGFVAVTSQDLFAETAWHSSGNLLKHLQRERIDGIMEVQEIGAGSNQVRFKYHAVKGLFKDEAARFDSLDAALVSLLR